MILVGNKNDLWQDRQVGTDQACQEAEEAGCSNFYEITTRESLDQVRVVFFEGVRRGLASGEHSRGYRRMRSVSTESPCLQETSPESEELSPTISPSPKTKIIVSKHIMASIKRKLMSKSASLVLLIWLRAKCQVRNRARRLSEMKRSGAEEGPTPSVWAE